MTGAEKNAALDIRVITLQSHWLVADSVKEALKAYGETIEGAPKIGNLPDTFSTWIVLESVFSVQKVYYALLYVVIEGYQELGLKDERIDKVLSDTEKVSLLRLFRNAIFHYQKEPHPFSAKVLGFLNGDYEGDWIKEVNKAFSAFFQSHLPIQEFTESLFSVEPPESDAEDAS